MRRAEEAAPRSMSSRPRDVGDELGVRRSCDYGLGRKGEEEEEEEEKGKRKIDATARCTGRERGQLTILYNYWRPKTME